MIRLASVLGLSAIALKFFGSPLYAVVPVAMLVYLVCGGWRWIILLSKIFPRDLYFIKMVIMLISKAIQVKFNKACLSDIVYQRARKHPHKLAFVMADTNESLTFKETEELCIKIANTFYEAGYRKGDVVALMMENRIEYIPIWLGLSFIGVITSLINSNLRGDSLKHCIDVCNCKGVIYSEEMSVAIKEIELELQVQMYCFDKGGEKIQKSHDIGDMMESASTLRPSKPRDLTGDETLLYMYTSGTTGFPKAVIWKGYKNILYAGFLATWNITEKDILYDSIPLFHGNGMIVASSFFINGCTVVVKKKFSASEFITDCCKYNITVINYIGEICRYVLSQPKSVFDKLNRIHLALGNGLRASIWTEFKDRFNITTITEAYASTEGNTFLVPNNFGRVGAVGFRPVIFPNRDLKLVRVDEDTAEPIRGPNGLAIEVNVGEPGMAVGIISKIRQFDGYTCKDETRKKIVHDILRKGDSAFLTGDILFRDEEGYYYFHDRIGDTFRWKGENVSTNEVEGLISKVVGLSDVCVYGVEVPGNEGKAGMACICDPERKINIVALPEALDRTLPKYAKPVFLRVRSSVEVTSTFKFQKKTLRKEGFAPHSCMVDDMLYYFDKEKRNYLAIDSEVYHLIMDKRIQF